MRAGEAPHAQSLPSAVHAGLLTLSQEIHCVVGKDGRLQYASATLAVALEREEDALTDMPFVHCLPVHVRAESEQRLHEALQGRGEVLWEAPCGEGEARRLVAWRARLQRETGLVLLVGRDVTEARRTEEELRSSQRLLKTVFDTVPHLLFVKDRESNYLMANSAWVQHHGGSAENLIGRHTLHLEHRPTRDRELALELDRQTLTAGHTIETVYERVVLDGTTRQFRNYRTPLRDDAGEIVGIVGISEDITEQIKAQQELRASQRLLRQVVDALPHNVFVKDREGRFVMVNRAMGECHGVEPDDLLGLRSEQLPGMSAEQARHLEAQDQSVLHSGQMHEVPEVIIRLPDGRQRNHRVRKLALYDDAERAIGVVCVSEDITERRRAEEDLRASQRLLRIVMDALPHAIFLKDRDLRFVVANRAMAAFFGVPLEQMIGRTLAELPGPGGDQIEILERTDRQVLESGHLLQWPELRLVDGQGRSTFRRLHKLPLRDDRGHIQGVIGISEDISDRKRAEEELRASQRLLRLLVDALPLNIYVKDMERRYVLVNRTIAEFHGITPEAMVGLRARELRGPTEDEAIVLEDTDRQVLEAGRLLEWPEVPITSADGTTSVRRVIKLPLRDAEGHVQGIVGVSEDITERKRAMEELRASRGMLQTVFDALPHLCVVMDREGRYVTVNRRWQDAYGVSAEEMRGRHTMDVDTRPAADRERTRMMDQEAIDSGRTLVHEYESTVASGERRRFQTIRSPLFAADGTVTGVLGVAMDVTEGRRAEEEVRASRTLLRTVFDALPLWVFVKDVTGSLVMVNRRMAEDHGVGEAESLRPGDAFLSTALTPAQRVQVAEMDRRALAGEAMDRTSIELTLANGETRRYRSIRVPLRDGDGAITGIVGISEDVTERERVEQAVQQAQKLESLGVLAGGIAHDFNNLLVSVLGYAQLVTMELPPESPVQPLIRQIETAGRRASELCNQMLAYAGKASFQVSRIHLGDLIREMTDLLHVSLSRNVRLDLELPLDLPPVEADATQLRQVVMNLVINASEAIGDRPGVIRLRCEAVQADEALINQFVAEPNLPPGPYVLFEVADNGTGMDMDTQKRMFEPFFTTKFTGRGLGLAAVLGIIRGHRGALRVSSAPQVGTTFTLLLPRASAKKGAVQHEPVSSPWQGAGTVLVVDDEASIRHLTTLVLQQAGFLVVSASNGEAAVDEARRLGQELRVVLLDVTMPGLSCEETLHRLHVADVHAPVIVMSGHGEAQVRERFSALSVAGYLPKPFTGETLRAKLEEVLGTPAE